MIWKSKTKRLAPLVVGKMATIIQDCPKSANPYNIKNRKRNSGLMLLKSVKWNMIVPVIAFQKLNIENKMNQPE